MFGKGRVLEVVGDNSYRFLALIVVALLALSARTSVLASPGDALPYSKGFLLTGNYLASGVDLTEQANPIDANGFSTGICFPARGHDREDVPRDGRE